MIFESIKQQVQSIFDQAYHPNIFSPDFKFHKTLETLPCGQVTVQESIRIISNILNAVLYLKSNKLNPCQFDYNYIGCNINLEWGLKFAICYRNIKSQKSRYLYDPSEFYYHMDEDGQLVWNLGKIWIRLFTKQKISIFDKKQAQIDLIIDKYTNQNKQISNLLKQMLISRKQKRLLFHKLIQNKIFNSFQQSQPLYSSIYTHCYKVSKSINSSTYQNKQIKTPYEEQILRRDMKQAIEICKLLQMVIKDIDKYMKRQKKTDYQIQIDNLLIKTYGYCLLKNLDQKKQSSLIQDYHIDQRKFYTKYVQKMLYLKHQISRKVDTDLFKQHAPIQIKKYLQNLEQLTIDLIHQKFKNITINYYELIIRIINKQLEQQSIISLNKQKFALRLILLRCCKKLFSQLRSTYFQNYLKLQNNQKKVFKLQEFLNFVDNTDNYVILKQIRNKIVQNFFKTS